MTTTLKSHLWQQFGAAIDMLENAIAVYPDEEWNNAPNFCRLSHHTVFYLDYYLSDTPDQADYFPPPPFTKSEFERKATFIHYKKEDLLMFVGVGREKLRAQLSKNTDEELLTKRFTSKRKDFTLFEMLMYNMRHVQHHAAQLNLLLRQAGITPPGWVSVTKRI
ncbi:DinB family protein [Chitinophaga sp. 212800010-3]|uniref:DinB family protein n=1 Tax=unclassified Chitinophaga TaxID=2619133 RepID=UPI002DF2A479|nr:DinB-2 domain-containing protein [Chitinophaga sp. 212800010-3]